MKVEISEQLTPQYFTKVYQSALKKTLFDAWYRGIKATALLKKNIHSLVKASDDWFKEHPDYVEGALCGKLKEK